MNKTRLVLVDDHPIFIQGLKIIIDSLEDFTVVGEAGNISDAQEIIKSGIPDIVIVDLNLGDEDGLDLIKLIKREYPDTKTIALSTLEERHYAERALNAGARGYIMKAETGDVLIKALESVLSGKIYLSEEEQSRYLESLFSSGKTDKTSTPQLLIQQLSDRQLQLLTLIGKGLGTTDIAVKLFISPKTVEAHKYQIRKKLQCKSSQELLQIAIEWANRH